MSVVLLLMWDCVVPLSLRLIDRDKRVECNQTLIVRNHALAVPVAARLLVCALRTCCQTAVFSGLFSFYLFVTIPSGFSDGLDTAYECA